jgi:para-aminobenzoate synthetase component I
MIRSIRFDQPEGTLPESRWTFAGRPAALQLICRSLDEPTELFRDGRRIKTWADVRQAVDWLGIEARNTPPDHRWAGYIGYEVGRAFESLPARSARDVMMPMLLFASVKRAAPPAPRPRPRLPLPGASRVRSTFDRSEYLNAVRRCLDYIAAGDVFQINLSQRFHVKTDLSPRDIYANLLDATPAHYGALLECDDVSLICNSPELFLQVSPEGLIRTRPIKGTRPVGADAELRSSDKDAAELNMIVDLERNDLGRVCEVGTVRVTERRVIERHPTVLHGVATVEGTLRRGVGLGELLSATFPGGSITGAPKIRAMQIIDELEPVWRNAYCGAIGYLDPDGTTEFNVAIRTMMVQEGNVYIPVGGGIVADSTPASEYAETIVKAKAMFAALGLVAPPELDESDVE